uniref:Uncharacterized protein n=1 Tax=Strongyloides stercoralis TaxID=6248 RepID=A0A0K0ETR3_STRER
MVLKKTCEIYLDLLKDVDEVHEQALQFKSSTEYNGIASNVLHKTMVLVIIYERIEINIILSISNNLSNNKITSLDYGSVSNVIIILINE